MFRRVTQDDLANGNTQVNVYFFINEKDLDNMVVASVSYEKDDPQQTLEDFVAAREADLADREGYAATLPPPEPGDPAEAKQRLEIADLIGLLVEKDLITKQDVADAAAAEAVPALDPGGAIITPRSP